MALTTKREVVVDEYTDPVTGQWVRERHIREVPIDDRFDVVDRQITRRSHDDGDGWTRRRRHRNGSDYYYYQDDDYRRRQRSRNGDNNDRRVARGCDPSSSSSGSESDSRSRDRDRRCSRGRGDGQVAVRDRARSEQSAAPPHPPPSDRAVENDQGYLWYSMKGRDEANWAERHFDSSYDGVFAAAAGAAIGVLTAARFTNDEHKTRKTIGAALAGGIAMNAAENWYRVYTEEREERKEAKKERRKEKRSDDG